jgi:RNase H-like domain found in reverse transcriptase
VISSASVFGRGAMDGQGMDWQTCHPTGFLSKSFSDAQRNYHTYEQEMIVILKALLKWEDKLISRCFHIMTNHKALEFFQMQCRLTVRQMQWM